MSEAPEKIWAWPYAAKTQDDLVKGGWNDDPDENQAEYTRTDLLEETVRNAVMIAIECAALAHESGSGDGIRALDPEIIVRKVMEGSDG